MRLKLTCSTVAIATLWSAAAAAQSSETFNRIATFPVASNLPSDRDPATPTVAEIVAASEDGMTLVYTDSQQKALGVVDIADPKAPKPAGFVALEGEPTSVAVANGKALVAVVTSESNDKPSGRLVVVDIASKAVESTCELGGQPDAVAFNPDKSRLAVVLENERDEELNDGELPQLPSGALAILSVDSGAADCASMRTVDLAGLADVAGDDAEPEFADVHSRRKAEPLEALLNTRGAGRDDGCGRGSGLRSATASSTAPMRSAADNIAITRHGVVQGLSAGLDGAGFFYSWSREGRWLTINHALIMDAREKAGREAISRSLMDFAKLVDAFDANAVTFVSVN